MNEIKVEDINRICKECKKTFTPKYRYQKHCKECEDEFYDKGDPNYIMW